MIYLLPFLVIVAAKIFLTGRPLKITIPAGRHYPTWGVLLRMWFHGLYGIHFGKELKVGVTFHRPANLPGTHNKRPHGKVFGRSRGRGRDLHRDSDRIGFGYTKEGIDVHSYSYVEGQKPWILGGAANCTLLTLAYDVEHVLDFAFNWDRTFYGVQRGDKAYDGQPNANWVSVLHPGTAQFWGWIGTPYQGGKADTLLAYPYSMTMRRIK